MRLAIAACAFALAILGQDAGSCSLQGTVRDSQGKPVAGVTVQLMAGENPLTALTDTSGAYLFPRLPAGKYTLHAAITELGKADAGPFALSPGDAKRIDLTLGPAEKAQFFDEPTFIVAGVTDPSLRGGHGSDPVFHSAEKLTKETASLRTNSPDAGNAEQLREADRRHALADEDEKRGDALDAVREYQRAAELESSERNLFDWGVELLKHRAADQAGEVFAKGHHAYPLSTRMLLGLAVALYSRGSYDQAAQRFFEAADLNPGDPVPYMFLGRLPGGPITGLAGYAERLERFARLQPENAWANYYYAACLWRRRASIEDAAATARVESLLEKSVRLDPHLGEAYLLLGVIAAEQGRHAEAIAAFQKAIAASPPMEEAHYRLAQAWRTAGQPDKARKEIELYRQLSQQSAQAAERERSTIQEFVFSLRGEK